MGSDRIVNAGGTPADDGSEASEERWQTVLSRDGSADGRFVYAVKTTGVYCRPSCPSKTAKRGHVEFFDSPELAESAGYRACKRCLPDGVSPEQARKEMALRACRAMETSETAVSLAELAETAGLSRYHFHRVFKEVTGLTPGDYQRSVRRSRVAASLGSAASVTATIYDAGFNSSGRFYAGANAMLGMPPRSYREGAPGQEIRYAAAACALGMVMVAATRKGVCAIEFGDCAPALVECLRRLFPKAELRAADEGLRHHLEEILAYLQHPRGLLDLPLDIQGTVFQQRVWRALQSIPAGHTATYAQIAQGIGKPEAARAVARACADNRLAVAIPCHRALRTDGGLAGYRWGIERKAELLSREAEEGNGRGPVTKTPENTPEEGQREE
jgi:AraC family transcriptional regulator of adaptative response/methylated-DNA-[protein]-cysteine methyltransferase